MKDLSVSPSSVEFSLHHVAMTSAEATPHPAPHPVPARPAASRGFTITAWLGGGLSVALLALCVTLGFYSWFDTSSSTAAIGVVIAIILAVPALLAGSLTLAGVLSHRAHPGTGFGLVLSGAIIIGIVAGLVGLQLLVGS